MAFMLKVCLAIACAQVGNLRCVSSTSVAELARQPLEVLRATRMTRAERVFWSTMFALAWGGASSAMRISPEDGFAA
eukprot:869302-Amphidinium_carterae.1